MCQDFSPPAGYISGMATVEDLARVGAPTTEERELIEKVIKPFIACGDLSYVISSLHLFVRETD